MPFITGIVSIGVYSTYSVLISVVFRKVNNLLSLKGNFIQGFAILLYIGVSYVLMCKYSMRATPHYGYVCLIYSMVLAVFLQLANSKLLRLSQQQAARWFWPLLIIFTVAMLAVQYHFDPMENKVDRWSAIAYPIQYLLQGDFPYMAKTHLGGNASPFPAWLLFHVPFYLFNNVGLSEIFTTVLFVFSIRKLYGSQAACCAIVLLAMCINLWYEIAVRSDLISNFLGSSDISSDNIRSM